jgi:beta-glucanase (GH16 family)
MSYLFRADFSKFNVAIAGSPGTFAGKLYPGPNDWEYGNPEGEFYMASNPGQPNSPFGIIGQNNDTLNIHAFPTPASALAQCSNQPYISGIISTHDWFSFLYGRASVVAKLPAGQGAWPAFWMLGADDDYGASGELDIFEAGQGFSNGFQSTVHGMYGGNWQTPHGNPKLPFDPTAGFHTYTVDWAPDTITWYADGVSYFQAPTPDNMKSVPMYLMVNLATFVGNTWSPPAIPPSTFDITIKELLVAPNKYTSGGAIDPKTIPKVRVPMPNSQRMALRAGRLK